MVGWNAAHTANDLCIAALGTRRMTPRCKLEPGLLVGHTLQWSPDGRTLLAFGATASRRRQGLVRWRSAKPFSADVNDWGSARYFTPTSEPGSAVLDAALSPDGRTLAVAAKIRSADFRLYLTTPNDFVLAHARRTPVRACKVAWRPDSRELVVVQAGALCQEDTGELTAVPIDNLDEARTLAANGDNPAFQPLKLSG
jgi:hypothetical protein